MLKTILLVLAMAANAQPVQTFLGRKVTITEPGTDTTGMFPTGPASVCLEGPRRQCYTAPRDYGGAPSATVVQVTKDLQALFFSAASGGVSGNEIHFALLRPGTGKELDNLLLSDDVSNQSEYAFWAEPSISDAKIFVTADFAWGRDEAHYDEHRYIMSAYLFEVSKNLARRFYYLEDRYMTLRKYPYDDDANKTDILEGERTQILQRLKRVVQERK